MLDPTMSYKTDKSELSENSKNTRRKHDTTFQNNIVSSLLDIIVDT